MTEKRTLNVPAGNSSAELRPFDARPLVVLGLVVGAALVAFLNLLFDGNVVATIGLVAVFSFAVISVFRPSVSLYVLVFLALAIEQLPQEYSWTWRIPYHRNLNNIFPGLSGLAINPVEIHLLCIISGLALRFLLIREKHIRVIAWKPLLLYLGAILFFVAYGVFRGGQFLPALWETRAIIYLVLLMAIVPQVIRTEDQVRHMIWAIIFGLGFRAVEVTRHFAGAGFSLVGSFGGWGNHEDAGLLATLVVFAVAMLLYRRDKKQMVALAVLLPMMIISIIASDRRTAYPVMAGGFILFVVMQPPEVLKRILSYTWKFGIIFVIYLAVFWNTNSTSFFMLPVKNIREGLAGDDRASAAESYTSNLYRKVENWDLYSMITERPLLGTGYGVPIDYKMPIPLLWDLGFYIPHNQILAVIAKTGVIGFAIFMFFYLSVMAEVGHSFGKFVKDKYMQAVLILIGAAVVNHLVFSFFDIVLTYYRNNIYLGALFGLASTIIHLQIKKAEEESAPPPAPVPQAQPHWLLLKPPEKVIN